MNDSFHCRRSKRAQFVLCVIGLLFINATTLLRASWSYADMDGDSDTWTDPDTQVATTLADMNMQGLDLDSDGVTNSDEAIEGTNPYSGDSDLDGMTDGEEIATGCDPLVDDAHADYDGDRYPNIFEVKNASDPFSAVAIPTAQYVVDPNGSGTHTNLYDAASWASSYEIILVQPGIYTGWANTGFTLY